MKKRQKIVENTKKRYLLFMDFIKQVLNWVKNTATKKSVSIGISILAAVMLLLGLSIDWKCGTGGWQCEGGYTPPAPEDVNKILKQGNNR